MIEPVHSQGDIKTVVKLANAIWHEHYAPMIGTDQVSYMLENFHSKAVIEDEIANQGHLYFLIKHQGRAIGYMGVQPLKDEGEGVLKLAKLYILSSERSRGIGRMAIGYLVDLADDLDLNRISLTVNKNNTHSIAAYKKMGFEQTGTALTDIGGGYVMDDFVMELVI